MTPISRNVPSLPPCFLQELAEAKAQFDSLSHIKRGLEQQKAELEAKVAQAAAALNAAEELKELRWVGVATFAFVFSGRWPRWRRRGCSHKCSK